ncbi:hypothetical protein pipiens_019001, partial [Culex pipiens pipiens]
AAALFSSRQGKICESSASSTWSRGRAPFLIRRKSTLPARFGPQTDAQHRALSSKEKTWFARQSSSFFTESRVSRCVCARERAFDRSVTRGG